MQTQRIAINGRCKYSLKNCANNQFMIRKLSTAGITDCRSSLTGILCTCKCGLRMMRTEFGLFSADALERESEGFVSLKTSPNASKYTSMSGNFNNSCAFKTYAVIADSGLS